VFDCDVQDGLLFLISIRNMIFFHFKLLPTNLRGGKGGT